MLTKTERVRAAIATCGLCFEVVGKDMWTPTERVEALWIEIEAQLDRMTQAEEADEMEMVRERLEVILGLVTKIEGEMAAA